MSAPLHNFAPEMSAHVFPPAENSVHFSSSGIHTFGVHLPAEAGAMKHGENASIPSVVNSGFAFQHDQQLPHTPSGGFELQHGQQQPSTLNGGFAVHEQQLPSMANGGFELQHEQQPPSIVNGGFGLQHAQQQHSTANGGFTVHQEQYFLPQANGAVPPQFDATHPAHSNAVPHADSFAPAPSGISYSHTDSCTTGTESSLNFFADSNELRPIFMGDEDDGTDGLMCNSLVLVDAEELMEGHDEEIDTEMLDTSEALAHSVMRILCRSNKMDAILSEHGIEAGNFIPFVQRHLSHHVPPLAPLMQDSDACTTSSDESTEDTESTASSELSDFVGV